MKRAALALAILAASALAGCEFFTPRNFSVTYAGNGNTSGAAPVDNTMYAIYGIAKVASPGSLARTGYVFAAWNTKADGSGTDYVVARLRLTESVALHARWDLPAFTGTVSYDGNGGGTPPADTTVYASSASALALAAGSLTRTEGAAQIPFGGWNTKADGTGIAYASGEALHGSGPLFLYAQWKDLILGTWTKTINLGTFAKDKAYDKYDMNDRITVDASGYSILRTVYDAGTTNAVDYNALPLGKYMLGLSSSNPQEIEQGTFTRSWTSTHIKTGYTSYWTQTKDGAEKAHVWYSVKFSRTAAANDTLTIDDGGSVVDATYSRVP